MRATSGAMALGMGTTNWLGLRSGGLDHWNGWQLDSGASVARSRAAKEHSIELDNVQKPPRKLHFHCIFISVTAAVSWHCFGSWQELVP